jgi:hypothetical protein
VTQDTAVGFCCSDTDAKDKGISCSTPVEAGLVSFSFPVTSPRNFCVIASSTVDRMQHSNCSLYYLVILPR